MALAHTFGVTTVKFQPFSDIFLVDKARSVEFFASHDMLSDIQKSMSEVIRLAREYRISTNPEGYLHSIPAYLCGGPQRDVRQNGCPALWTSCPISAQGDVFPCWVLSRIVVGNVKAHKLSEVWGSARHDKLRMDIITNGCRGCMMSCYDNNFGKDEWDRQVTLKLRKFSRKGFYRRMYFRVHQNVRYVLGKAVNRINLWRLIRRARKVPVRIELLKELQEVRTILHNKMKSLKP